MINRRHASIASWQRRRHTRKHFPFLATPTRRNTGQALNRQFLPTGAQPGHAGLGQNTTGAGGLECPRVTPATFYGRKMLTISPQLITLDTLCPREWPRSPDVIRFNADAHWPRLPYAYFAICMPPMLKSRHFIHSSILTGLTMRCSMEDAGNALMLFADRPTRSVRVLFRHDDLPFDERGLDFCLSTSG